MPGKDDISYLRAETALALAPKAVGAGTLSSGLLTLAVDDTSPSGALIELADGTLLGGIKITDSAGFDVTLEPTYQCPSVFVRCPAGAASTLLHESGAVASRYRLVDRRDAADVALDDVTLLHLVYDPAVERWIVYKSPSAVAVYSGTTSVSGTYEVTYAVPYASTPTVLVQLRGGTNNPHQFARLTTSTQNGFIVTTYERASASVLGVDPLSSLATTVNGLVVDVVVYPP